MATPTTQPSQPPQSAAPRRPMRNNAALLRLVSRVIVGALVVVVVGVLVVHTLVNNGPNGQNASPVLQGTSLGGKSAPDFTLTDQNGARVSLADLRGHPVVLTFFFTHCTSECPLTASKFQRVLRDSGSQLKDVRWVAISTDPSGDSPQLAREFVANHGLTGSLRYLLGSAMELAPVWSSYGVSVEHGGMASGAAGAAQVMHTGGVWLIDAQGREQVYLDAAFNPQTLASDLKIMAGK